MQNEDAPGRELRVDEPGASWTRRRVLAGVGATGFAALAGCSSGGSGDGDGDSGGVATDGTNADDGSGSDTDGSGEAGGDGTASSPAAMGQVVEDQHVSFVVEYARPIDEVVDYSDFPQRHEEGTYGVPRTVSYYASQGFTDETTEFYAVGVAVQNTHDRPVDASTMFLENDGGGAVMTFPGRGQRLTYHVKGGSTSPLLPAEVARGEVVFALPDAPDTYQLRFRPFEVRTGAAEPILVDLGSGAEGTATFGQAMQTRQYGSPAPVGDFDVTLHAVDRLASIEDSPHQEYFGPREDYDYLRVDLSATRTSDEMVGQDWSLGMADDDGYGFGWSTVYDDVYDLNRIRIEQLSIGETLENTVLAFPVETSFDPTYLTMNAVGPFEEPPESGSDVGVQRIAWSLE